jgi:hypothetical protein
MGNVGSKTTNILPAFKTPRIATTSEAPFENSNAIVPVVSRRLNRLGDAVGCVVSIPGSELPVRVFLRFDPDISARSFQPPGDRRLNSSNGNSMNVPTDEKHCPGSAPVPAEVKTVIQRVFMSIPVKLAHSPSKLFLRFLLRHGFYFA